MRQVIPTQNLPVKQVPRHRYIKLRVACLTPRDFAVSDLRGAVDYLKTIAGTSKHIGLVAIGETVKAGRYLLDPTPMLTLKQISGKTPAEVWAAFDADLDEQLSRLGRGHRSNL